MEAFLEGGRDLERAQYHILARLQDVRAAFAASVIYPHLRDLIELYSGLQTVLERLQGMQDSMPKRVQSIDLDEQRVVYEQPDLGAGQLGFIAELIQWGLPQVKAVIEEGRTIFEFVEENLSIEEVGIMPSYVEEGYMMVPDVREDTLHVLLYSQSIITQAEERFRSLKTQLVKSIRHRRILPSLQSIKVELLAENRSMPNPATYFLASEIDFPYEATLLPVAKRKLMRHLAVQGGAA